MRKLIPAIALIAAVPGAAQDRNRVPIATPAGEPVQCIPIRAIRESRVRSDQVIDFVAAGRRTYRVTLPQRCPGLNFERSFTYATSLDRLCAQDIITVLYQGGGPQRGASCGLAPFQPVTLATRR